MIYASSSCSSKTNIKESILELVHTGITNIELSGGTNFYPALENDLLELKNKHQLNFLLHNYFPPPKEHFVLNLASKNFQIIEQSKNHLSKAIGLSKKLGADKYGIHAGFFIDPHKDELGKAIRKTQLTPENEGREIFIGNFTEVLQEANVHGVKLYLENNVLSAQNHNKYGVNPFMLTNKKAFLELKNLLNFELLLDVAHLKVSCNSLGLNFEEELKFLSAQTDYIHLSDNDGFSDTNLEISKNSDLFKSLQKCDLKNKTISLEIYSGIDRLVDTIENIRLLVED